MKTTAYWCLGSNIQPTRHISDAIRQFAQDFEQIKVSKLYRNPAVGFAGADFINAVVATKTELELADLLNYADKLEKAAGRTRVARGNFDSRTLDVDLLTVGDLCGTYLDREWPNADITNFAHVLIPLAEIAPHVEHPGRGQTFAELLEADFSAQQLSQVQPLEYD